MGRLVYLLCTTSLFFLIFINTAAGGDDSESCKRCHEDVYKKALASPFQHSVAKDGCVVCHSLGASNLGMKWNIRKVVSRAFHREKTFSLKELKDGREYRIEVVAIDRGGRESEPKVLTIKPVDVAGGEITPLRALREVTVEEVSQGIFVMASVSWLTDTPATTEVEYGLTTDLKNHITGDDHYTREHRIPITGLLPDKKYYFMAVSKDILGNVARSDRKTIDTSRFFSKRTRRRDSIEIAPIIYNAKVFRTEGEMGGIYLSVSLSEPSKIRVTISEEIKDREKPDHLFPSERYTAITVCIKCHRQGASHPVGIRARKPGIITPDDLPTIEGGMLTCTTCHDPHGGSRMYLARVAFDRNICVKCHVSDPFL